MAKNGPEVWHAKVLRDEAAELTAAVRMLEYRAGWHDAKDGWALEDVEAAA